MGYGVISMKKDQKFLLKLEECLSKVNKKNKDKILLKYREMIDNEKVNGRRIVDIIKSLGTPEEIAQKEIESIASNNWFKQVINNIKNMVNSFKNKIKKEVKKNDNVVVGETSKEEPTKEETSEEVIENKKTDIEKVKKIKNEKNVNKDKTIDRLKVKFENLFKKKDNNKKTKRKSKSKKTKYIRRIKWNFKNFKENFKLLFKKKSKTEKVVKKIKKEKEEIVDDTIEKLTETKIFETKGAKIRRVILNTFAVLLMIVFIFIYLWIMVIFIASLFSVLDGLKVYGVVLTLFGLMVLMLWFVLLMYKLMFRKKVKALAVIISVVVIVSIIGCGCALTMREYYKIKNVKDVSEKYNMTTFSEKYSLPNKNKKLYISFNSNYKTSYVVEYDETLDNKIKVEVRYYECYYDFYIKKTTNNLYVSLKLDPRDRLSVYIDNLKDNKIFDNDELSRYTVKITMNEENKDKVVILK